MNGQEWQQESRARLFDAIPSGVVVIDPSLTVVDHNQAFATMFGEARGVPCYAATKGRTSPCSRCPAQATFSDGKQRVIEQRGTDRTGRDVHYLVHITPFAGDNGDTAFVAAITTDLTATRRLQQEYQTLFEKVPCFVSVINREYRVVKANEAFRRVFGEPTGEHCYRLYKKRHEPCPDCPADRTFQDGGSHSSRQIGVATDGRTRPYLVFTAPLLEDNGEVTHVIEMALDMTEHQDLEEQLSRANVMRLALVESSLDTILVFDEKERILMVNRAAEKLLGYSRDELIGRRAWKGLIPKELQQVLNGKSRQVALVESMLTTADDDQIPVRVAGVALELDGRFMGSAIIAQDLREIKQLEREKLEAERLAAVGQTVAGLAHGIKNIITGLEGGMYVTSSGMKRGDQERVREGWEMLVRNMGRISELTKNLLAFSRGERLECQDVTPAEVAREVVALYRDSAKQQGIDLQAEVVGSVAPAWMDPDGLHSCLANLVSNAVDACLMSERAGCTIVVRLRETDGTIIFEIVDTGCGMDYDVKQRVFTSFFTTKGKGGTGIGLLLTRKIVQQHGGSIELISEPGTGTTFRLSFPRDHLPQPEPKEDRNDRG